VTNTRFWSESLNGRDQLEDLGEDGNIIYEWVLNKYDERMMWAAFIELWIGTSGGLFVNTVMNLRVV